MNNEEKILEMLGQLQQGQQEMRADISDLKNGQAKLEAKIDVIQEDIEVIKEDVAALQYNVGKIGTWAERVGPKVDIGVYDGD